MEFGDSGWNKKIHYYYKQFNEIALDLVNVRVHMLITLGNQVFMALQKSPGLEAGFAATLDLIRLETKAVSHPADYVSNKHVIQDVILLAGIYGCDHPPEKVMTITWDPVLPLTNRSAIFRSNELLPFHSLVILSNCKDTLHCLGSF